MHNALRVVPPLRAVAGTLTKLELSHQLLSHMRGLGELPALRELILNNNAIARIEGLHGCRRLERLWLFSNRIERVENLAPLGDLHELWLQDNGIESLRGGGLEQLVNLRQLCLAGNPIESTRELEALTFLPSLAELSFADRFFWTAPIADASGYRELVIRHLKQVATLDGFDILPEERSGVEDRHLRSIFDFNDSIEDLHRKYMAHVDELEAMRERNLATAGGIRDQLVSKLRELERLVQDSRARVMGAAEAAARRREKARAELRRNLASIAKDHARCVERMMARFEAEAVAEEAFFRRRRRRAKFQRKEIEGYLSLGRPRAGAAGYDGEKDGEDGGVGGQGTSEEGRGTSGTEAIGVYELVEGGKEMQQVRQEMAAAAGAAGELPPRAAAAAAAALAAAAAASQRGLDAEPIVAAAFEANPSVSTGTVLTLGAYRIVSAAWATAFQRRAEAAIDQGARGGTRRVLKWAFLGVTPDELRAVLASDLEAATGGGMLRRAAVCTDGIEGYALRLHRSAGGAYDALQEQTPSSSTSSREDDGGGDEDAPAAIVMCQVLANPSVAAAWERVAPRRKNKQNTTGHAREHVLSEPFAVEDILPQYILHLERAPKAGTDGGLGFHPAEVAGDSLAIQAHAMDLLEAPVVSPAEAAELRALEDRVEAEARQYRYDLWHEMDADVAADVEDQDRELDEMRRELEAVHAAIAEERAAQDDVIRSFRNNAPHLHRLRAAGDVVAAGGGRRHAFGSDGWASTNTSFDADDASKPTAVGRRREGRAARHEQQRHTKHPSPRCDGVGGDMWAARTRRSLT